MADMRQQLLDTFIFETEKILEQLEQNILVCEKEGNFSNENVNEIFRCMHTIKSSSAMMMYGHISELAHAVEDLFAYIRENQTPDLPTSTLADLILESMDFIQNEIVTIKSGLTDVQDAHGLIDKSKHFLTTLKETKDKVNIDAQPKVDLYKRVGEDAADVYAAFQPEANSLAVEANTRKTIVYFEIYVFFYEASGMESVRAFQIEHELTGHVYEIKGDFQYVLEDPNAPDQIRESGYRICIKTVKSYQDIEEVLEGIPLIKKLHMREITKEEYQESQKYVIFSKEEGPEEAALPEEPIIFEDVSPAEVEEIQVAEQLVLQPASQPEIQPIIQSVIQDNVADVLEVKSKPLRLDEERFPVEKSPPESAVVKIEGKPTSTQSMISVNIDKLDLLMDLMGELVLSEAMVTRNPDLEGLVLNNFQKAARQHRKIVNELQDVIMDIRMVPITGVFQKMKRIIRDLNKKQNKNVVLKLIGEDTEVDKNIIEKMADPLMHMVRNSMDHGIESSDERERLGKTEQATITIEAKNVGREVLIIVRDNGRGLDLDKILDKANRSGILHKDPDLMTDREIYALILRPGFSTKEEVTEYSGRGVGMDVVVTNIQDVGGSVSIDSEKGKGTAIIMKIPLTLAIIEGMIVRVGHAKYTLPITTVRESFRATQEEIIVDPEGNEMIEVRGSCYPIVRLNRLYQISNGKEAFEEGILIMIESDQAQYGLFVDELICEQQVVVKPLPEYIKNFDTITGLTGCTILGDGSISLILDLDTLTQ